MSEALYERYKDALRRGHVAAMHGRSDAALAAYVEAATIAPDRALPHVSIGGVYQRSGRSRDALAAFDAALVRAPRDEGALAGRASALESLGRRSEAATTLDDLAAAQEAAARLADAADTARRALALAESRARRRAVEALVTRLREVEGGAGEAHADALASALRPLGPSGAGSASSDTAGDAGVQPSVGAASSDERPSEQGTADASPAAEPAPPPPLAELLAAWDRAEAAAASGDHASARRLFLELADGHARAGREDAALDACAAAIGLGPADPPLHLTLAAIYLDRGWRALAVEKLALLGRLADLEGDEATRARVRDLLASRVPDAPAGHEETGAGVSEAG